MRHLKKNTNGFISLNSLFILSVFLTLYFTLAVAFSITQTKNLIRKSCIIEATATQETTLKNIRELFKLNQHSTQLRLSIKLVKAQIAVAITTMNFTAIPPLEQTLRQLELAQKALDAIQKSIITKANAELLLGYFTSIKNINSLIRQQSTLWGFIIQQDITLNSTKNPKLSIKSDTEGGIAPNYEWDLQNIDQQSLSHFWSIFFKSNSSFQKYISWNNLLKTGCAVKPEVNSNLWSLKITTDKYL